MSRNATNDPFVRTGDPIQVFDNNGQDDRGKWISPRVVLSVDTHSGTVSVAGAIGHTIVTAF